MGLLCDGVDESVVEVDRMLQRRRPVLGGEAGAVEEGSCADGELVIIDLSGTVL